MENYFIYITSLLDEIRIGESEHFKKGQEETKTWPFWRAVLAEFIATFALVFFVSMTTIDLKHEENTIAVTVHVNASGGANSTEDHVVNHRGIYYVNTEAHLVRVALTVGLMMTLGIHMIAHVSGGHLNPSVTAAMAMVRAISLQRAVIYIAAQTVAACLATGILKSLLDERYHENIGLTKMNQDKGISSGEGFVLEMLFTFILVLSVLGVTDSNRPMFGSPALGIGFSYTAITLAGWQLTGASTNPARSLAGSIASTDEFAWLGYWMYWIAPLHGAIIAAVLYGMVLSPYGNEISYPDATDELLRNEDTIGIPRDFFSAGPVCYETKDKTNALIQTTQLCRSKPSI